MSATFAPFIQEMIHDMAHVITQINERDGRPTVEDLAEIAHIPAKVALSGELLTPELAGYVQRMEETMNAALQRSAQINGALIVDNEKNATGAHTGAPDRQE